MNFSVAEHHAIRSVGFTPVGQVMGACVWQVSAAKQEAFSCAMDDTIREIHVLSQSYHGGIQLSVDRMQQQCEAIGGDGVIAVRLVIGPVTDSRVEIQAIGTAVRAGGPVRPRAPFTSDLSGQEFAKLMIAGWVPCHLVIGMAIAVRHVDVMTQLQAQTWRNVEMTGYTDLVETARAAARGKLRDACIRWGGEGVVISRMTTEIHEQQCTKPVLDYRAEVLMTGTSITQFRRGGPPPAVLPIMRVTGGVDGRVVR